MFVRKIYFLQKIPTGRNMSSLLSKMTKRLKCLGGTCLFYTVDRLDVLHELVNIYLIFEPLYFQSITLALFFVISGSTLIVYLIFDLI